MTTDISLKPPRTEDFMLGKWMQKIATSVFNLQVFSTSETPTGEVWIGGEQVFSKVVSLGAMPNTTTESVAHGLTGVTFLPGCTGMADNGSNFIPLPYVSTTAVANHIQVQIDGTNIKLTSGVDFSSYTSGYYVLKYKKT